ncbi:Octicosapeptide/Phox/Bem1p family protein [Arabidopsis thaliana]|uniref:Octicosapeptide/Phox/Bem1p family protein n=1 Tax=Arabidopsis thaliana TaxID=3702 RepID=A0A1P8BCE3_ARATH|nr:Octicosapeptide/Phox/Bem1p family protein [Arabidopsis thaliana]ANM69261.1 Octicosapeptide/Phox/Bem1p family protein [Arabidopsis thaliana]|eukprot:NP_001330955.1 Octicosapeptide/Phox/Bem1p family protein [Arabidopsis thaliana]
MDKFSYNSYPDSAESSPRSRDVEFENPSPWEDQQQQNYKVKLMCSYGGKIQPRPHDNQLTYVNGDTKIMSVDRGIRFPALVSKLSAVCSGGGDGGEISFKYQLPGEDLDALISVTNDEDLEHMMHEYDRLLRLSTKPARMRLFLFPSSPISGGFGSEGSTKSDRDTLNPIPSRPESEKSVTAPPNNADFLFGSEKVAPIPPSPVKVPQPVPEPVVLEPPQMFVDQRMLQPEHGVNPAEIQRQIQEFQMIQIRDQEQQMLHQNQLHQQQQQQEAMYRRKTEDEAGRYFPPTYTQNPAPVTNQQPPVGYWQGNTNNSNIQGNIYTTTSQNLPEQQQQQQQVYMIPAQSQAPGTLYQSVMRPTVQGNQGYYPSPVQRLHHPDAYMEQQNQPGYNVVQPQPTFSGGPQVMTSVGPQVMTSVGPPMGLQEPYSQMGKPVYYTVAGEGMMVQPPPAQPQQQQQQYQGMGQPVSGMTDLRTGPDGKVAVNMAAPQVSDSV